MKDESNAPLRLTPQQPRPSEAGLKAKDIRIHVIAASLNFADALQVQVRQKPSHSDSGSTHREQLQKDNLVCRWMCEA